MQTTNNPSRCYTVTYQQIKTPTLRLACLAPLIVEINEYDYRHELLFMHKDRCLYVASHPLLNEILATNTHHTMIESLPKAIADLWINVARQPDSLLDDDAVQLKYNLRQLLKEIPLELNSL